MLKRKSWVQSLTLDNTVRKEVNTFIVTLFLKVNHTMTQRPTIDSLTSLHTSTPASLKAGVPPQWVKVIHGRGVRKDESWALTEKQKKGKENYLIITLWVLFTELLLTSRWWKSSWSRLALIRFVQVQPEYSFHVLHKGCTICEAWEPNSAPKLVRSILMKTFGKDLITYLHQ